MGVLLECLEQHGRKSGAGFSSDQGMIAQSKLDQLQETDVHPMNNLTLTAKLELAVAMAESLADIHGFSGGAIVHGDVHPDQ